MADKNIYILQHILRYCVEITEMRNRFGDSLDAFNWDYAYRHACTMCIVQIGELSANLTDDFKSKYNEIPWRDIKAMRNLFAHNYRKMDIERTWETIVSDIPALKAYCDYILRV